MLLKIARPVLRLIIKANATAIGLKRVHITDMKQLADDAHADYDNEARGGEGFMEVGKLIDCAENSRAHMMISVKPFGCMPSSGVSDGVQSLITARYPDAIFLPIETTGDGKAGVHSRVQMMLFKARGRAREEFDRALRQAGWSEAEAARRLQRNGPKRSALYCPRRRFTATAANMVMDLRTGSLLGFFSDRMMTIPDRWFRR